MVYTYIFNLRYAANTSVDETSSRSASPMPLVADALQEYFATYHPQETALLAKLHAFPQAYGSAYCEVLTVRLIRKLFDALQISTARGLSHETTVPHPNEAGTITISTADIVQWARIRNLKTYSHARRRVGELHSIKHWLETTGAQDHTDAADNLRAMLMALCNPIMLESIQVLRDMESPSAGHLAAVVQAKRRLANDLKVFKIAKGLTKRQLLDFVQTL